MLMYTDEMDMWIAEASQEEANNRARIRATLLQINSQRDSRTETGSSSSATSGGSAARPGAADDEAVFQVVGDDDEGGEVTTIQRSFLPDLNSEGEDQGATSTSYYQPNV